MEFKTEKKQASEPLDFLNILLLGATILTCVVAIVCALNYEILADKKHNIRNAQIERKIYSLKSSRELSGNFYLGYGTIGATDYYVYLQKDDKFNGFTKEKVPVSQTLIVEKNVEPNIVMNFQIVEDIETRPFFNKEYKSVDSLFYGIFDEIPKNVKYKYIITVPVGTVTEKLTFDPL